MLYYAMSDIHGHFNILLETMKLIELNNKKNKLVFLGDYIDYGKEGLKVLYFIKRLTEEYKGQVIAIQGNHEEQFLKKISMIDTTQVKLFKKEHKELICWLKKLPYYFQTERQIFVHAGILEEADELWMYGTPIEYFTSKYPAKRGTFYKDIIAGHIGTSELRKDKNNHDIYWDGKNHYYIDGTVQVSGIIPVLKYDTNTETYTSFHQVNNRWIEYRL